MTTEEKARAYDEALERAKEQIKECGDNEGRKKMIRSIFSELRESEDERTRKEIIHYLLFYTAGGLSTETQNRWIAYLEKQKEQKPTELYEKSKLSNNQ